MNDLEPNPLEPKSILPGTDANGASAGVQSQLNFLRIGLIVLSATFAFFLWMQVRYLRIERARFQPVIQGFEKDKLWVDPLLVRIAEYGRTRPAFAPIMQKFQLQVPTNAPGAPAAAKPAAPAAAKPAPAPAPALKK